MLYFIGIIVICGYLAIIAGSIILLILKVIERKKEKREEDWDKYDDY